MILLFVLYSLASISVFILLHYFFYQKAKYFNINKANQKAIRWSSQKKPVAGGITFFLSFLVASTFFLISQPTSGNFIKVEYLFISIALIIVFLIGLADDMLSISPNLKLFLQIIGASVFGVCWFIYQYF